MQDIKLVGTVEQSLVFWRMCADTRRQPCSQEVIPTESFVSAMGIDVEVSGRKYNIKRINVSTVALMV